ncbi:MAG: coproporphyrinogen dehydrogenase HemZ [Christensenellaceae bacterium]|nr:coproporphyrinogen dehydrogenase HemZ [Christensenellaceae bacterium]
MDVLLITPTEEYSKDVGDVVSLFISDYALHVNEDCAADIIITHDESIVSGTRKLSISLSGIYYTSSFSEEKIYSDKIVNKRIHKRQLKLNLYSALKEATSISPPWGALTGIRPTRLVYSYMAEGITLEESLSKLSSYYDVSSEKTELLKAVILEQKKYDSSDTRDVNIYVGIPFCLSRCRYCSFFSALADDIRLMERYTDCLIKEISAVKDMLKTSEYNIRCVYFGGGTPTALSENMLERIFIELENIISSAREVTVESGRPDSINREKLSLIKSFNIDRISINPQTKHLATLKAIGRNHTSEEIEQTFYLARDMGFNNINMDLIAGLPGEKIDMFMDTLNWASKMNPESLTVHTLSIKRASLMHLWKDSLPDGNIVSSMIDSALEYCINNKMNPYYLYRQKNQAGNLENIGFAKEGKACLYNIDTMEDTCSVIALGAGGISKRVWENRKLIKRSPNMMDPYRYIERIDEMIERKRQLFFS